MTNTHFLGRREDKGRHVDWVDWVAVKGAGVPRHQILGVDFFSVCLIIYFVIYWLYLRNNRRSNILKQCSISL